MQDLNPRLRPENMAKNERCSAGPELITHSPLLGRLKNMTVAWISSS